MKSVYDNLINFFGRFATRRNIFILTGIASTLWFLLRVIPKPTRATYPCMRAAAPVMSAFVCYLITLTGIGVSFKLFKKNVKKAHYWSAAVCAGVFAVSAITFNVVNAEKIIAGVGLIPHPTGAGDVNAANMEKQGIKPGRVVWVWDDRSTQPTRTPNMGGTQRQDYYNSANNDQYAIDRMLTAAVISVAGEEESKDIVKAWDKIFTHFNNMRAEPKRGFNDAGRAGRGYQAGETVFIKMNYTSINNDTGGSQDKNIIESNPFTLLALLKHLIEYVGVPQNQIYVGDPMRGFWGDNAGTITANTDAAYIKGIYPDVHLIRRTHSSTTPVGITYSKSLGVNHIPRADDKLHDKHYDATYVFNLPGVKGHARAGFTAQAKNFFGCPVFTNPSASHYHNALPINGGTANSQNGTPNYDSYRILMDLMASKHMGQKTVLYISDALYTGDEWDGWSNTWNIYPFNRNKNGNTDPRNPSSLFVSLDQVAIESVCLDFLKERYTSSNPVSLSSTYNGTPAPPTGATTARASRADNPYNYPNWDGVDDYLHQAADPARRPAIEGTTIDVDGRRVFNGYKPDGVLVNYSLGVHEHWNANKEYSLIDLVKIKSSDISLTTGGVNSSKPWLNMDAWLNYPGKEDVITVYHTTENMVMDGNPNEESWTKLPWMSMNFRWMDGSTSHAADDYGVFGKNPQGKDYFFGMYKLLWNSTKKELYILAKIRDNDFVRDTRGSFSSSWGDYWKTFDLLEVFFAPDKMSGNHQINNDGYALHMSANASGDIAYVYDIGSSTSTIVDLKSKFIPSTNGAKINKIGDYYYWEVTIKLDDVTQAKLNGTENMRFSLVYNNITNNGTPDRVAQYGNHHMPIALRNNSDPPYIKIESMGLIKLSPSLPPGSFSVSGCAEPLALGGAVNRLCTYNVDTTLEGWTVRTTALWLTAAKLPLNSLPKVQVTAAKNDTGVARTADVIFEDSSGSEVYRIPVTQSAITTRSVTISSNPSCDN